MDRRKFLKSAGLAAAGSAALATPAISQGMRELKMVTTWPKNLPGLGTGAERFANTVSALTDGQLTIKVFGQGELVGGLEHFDAVQTGTAEMYHGAEYYWQGKSKAFNFFAAVPMGLTAAEMSAWVKFGGGQELWDELSASFGVKSFMCGNTGAQMGGWFAKEINSTEDLKGLNFRMPGLGGEVLRALGANVVGLPGNEIFPALQSGAIDGTEWVGPWLDLAFGFYKVVNNYYGPGFHEPGTALSMGMTIETWESLTPSQQLAVKTAADAETDLMFAEINANNGPSLVRLVNEFNVQVKQFPEDVFLAIAKTSDEVVMASADDDITTRVRDCYLKARMELGGWTSLQETAYVNMRTKHLGM